MSKEYDVIVIGAGNGGLAAAAFAAKNGLKTLLVEKHNIPGGSATSFRRGRFEFEPSLHELCTVGTAENPGGILKLFQMLGADIDWRTDMEEVFNLVIPSEGIGVAMPCGVKEFIGALEQYCPGSAPSMMQFVQYAMTAAGAYDYLDDPECTEDKLVEKFPDFYKIAGHSLQEVLISLGMPEKARTIVETYWPYLGGAPDEIDFMMYSRMVLGYLAFGAGMSAMRSHEISLALEKVVRDSGGEIWYNTEVKKIIIEDGAAVGVEINGKEFRASHVVSNAHPHSVYGKMIDQDKVPEAARKLTNSRGIGIQFLTIYLGLNKSVEEVGLKHYTNFIAPCSDGRRVKDMTTDTHEFKGYVILNSLNIPIPECTPEGTCQLFFTVPYFGSGWNDVSIDEYEKMKEDYAEEIIKYCEDVLGITIMPYIEEIEIAGPPTFARYLNTPNGTAYGYQVDLADSFVQRGLAEKDDTFFKGLHIVGAASKRGDGYSSAYLSGIDVGKAILVAERQKGGMVR